MDQTDAFEAVQPRPLRIAGGVLVDRAEAEDVVQQAWIRLQGHLRIDPAEPVWRALGLHDDHRHAVGDHVVQVAGDAGALLGDRAASALELAELGLLGQLALRPQQPAGEQPTPRTAVRPKTQPGASSPGRKAMHRAVVPTQVVTRARRLSRTPTATSRASSTRKSGTCHGKS